MNTLTAQHNVWLSLGGFHQRAPDEKTDPDQRIRNTHCIVNAHGELVATYDKVHLFDVDYDGGFKESNSTRPGDSLLLVRDTPVGTIGVTTCYDLRFPEVYTALRDAGAQVLLIPSAFMPTTGAAHWEVLLRARAIETQCYVAAAAQCGAHNDKRSSYGHSLLVDPFGAVLCDLGGEDQACVGVCEVDLGLVESVREKMPVMQHRAATNAIVRVAVGPDRLKVV
jgi:predicted amidohydrolase